jgi:protein MpaA
MQPLRRNLGAYCGERIHVEEVQAALISVAEKKGWKIDWLECDDGDRFPVITRVSEKSSQRLYVSAGIHGDEPAGPMTILRLLRDDCWPRDASLWLCPLLNYSGFQRNSREDKQGIDLNRDYLHRISPRVRAHIRWLESTPRFEVGLHLHEDWESAGFYLYELNPRDRPTYGERVIQGLSRICPIDTAEQIDGRPAKNGILRPQIDPASQQEWPEAFFMVQEKTDLSYTLESPSDFPLELRVNAMSLAVRTLLAAYVA